MVKTRDKTFLGVLGVIILVFGFIGTIVIGVRGEEFFYGLPITAVAVIIGILLIAWAYTENGR